MKRTDSAGTMIARRAAVLCVIAIASLATLATSSAYREAQFERSGVATITLDAGSPRAVGTVVLDLSAATLPGPSAADPQPSGNVVFSLEPVATSGGYAPKGSDLTSSSAGQVASTEPLSLTVAARNVARPAAGVRAGWSWPIEALCRVAEPCHREFEVTVEWLRPVTGGSRSAELRVELTLRY